MELTYYQQNTNHQFMYVFHAKSLNFTAA